MEFNYKELIENVQDLVFALSWNGKILYVNRQFSQFVGRTKEQLHAFTLSDFVYLPDVDWAEENVRETLKGRSRTFEVRLLSATNEPVYFSTNLTPIREGEQVIGVIGISRDINERMKLEQEITELKNFHESIIQSIQAGLITTDLLSRITSFNAGAEEILQCSAKDVLGKPLREVVGENIAQLFLQQDAKNGVPPNRETTLKTRNGHEVHIGFTVTPRLDDKGLRVGTIISFKDISQIKRMQAEVIRMDRLASLGVLASGIAHEIKNPLAGIKAMAQTLQEDMVPQDERRVYLERIVRQVNRLDELLKTFFDYARPRPPIRKLHRIQDILHEVFTLVEKRLEERHIRWRFDIAPAVPPIFVDFHQIQQVLLNLIFNAIDAMEHGGDLHIAASPYNGPGFHFPPLQMRKNKINYVELSVSDTGIGIDEKNLEIIFDPFFTTKSQGTGLGLSIVYRIIAAHGGEIAVESKPGYGTTFRLLLPTEEQRI